MKEQRQHHFSHRIVLLGLCLGTVLAFYLYRLLQVQIVNGEEYAQMARQSTVREQVITAARGEIVDRYGRPLAINRQGFDIIFDRAYMPSSETNEIILRLMEMMEEAGEEWIDNLPITDTAPFDFLTGADGSYDAYATEIAAAKSFAGVQEWATADEVLYWLVDRYELGDYDPETQRKLAGVRYEMDQRGYSITVQYTFASDVDISTVTTVMEHSFELPGVDVVENPVREYVSGDLFPHIIGRIGPIYQEEYETLRDKGYQMNDQVGKMGIEAAFENYLRGTDGTRQITVDHQGLVVDIQEGVEAVPGNTVMLTLDSRLQRVAQDALAAQIQNLQETAPEGEGREADAGAVVAIEVETGDVLVCATYPSYDINEYSTNYSQLASDPLNPLYNRALRGEYAAGSIFKPAVALGGLNEGVIDPDTTVNCQGRYTRWTDYQPGCLGVHGETNVTHALQVSCNVFFYETGWNLGIDRINQYAQALGLGRATGVELTESLGHLSSPAVAEEMGNDWQDADVVQSAIGQAYNLFTPIQMANYTATLARGGVWKEAHLVKSVQDYTFNETVWEPDTDTEMPVDASEEAFDTVKEGMIAATSLGGTSYSYWADFPIQVASKTGTPQTTAYPNSTYICYLPADDPKLAIAVVIEQGWHGYTGAPVARAIAEAYFYGSEESTATQQMGTLIP